jgi:hypothetical protein
VDMALPPFFNGSATGLSATDVWKTDPPAGGSSIMRLSVLE